MPAISELRTPALVCYRSVLERNARAMLDRAERLGCALRPHVKTVKTAEAAAIATGGTRRRVTCSTLAEASFLAAAGFDSNDARGTSSSLESDDSSFFGGASFFTFFAGGGAGGASTSNLRGERPQAASAPRRDRCR